MAELDLFCKDPLVLVEVTNFLGKNEFDKLQKIFRLGALIAKREGKNPESISYTLFYAPDGAMSACRT
jgi:hypothetical protein